MDRLTLISRIGADGVLNVSVPIGASDANRPVQVTIELASDTSNGSADYSKWLDGLAGRWEGEILRGDEGSLEVREPF